MSIPYLSGVATGIAATAATCLGVKYMARKIVQVIQNQPTWLKLFVVSVPTRTITAILGSIVQSGANSEFQLGFADGFSVTKSIALYAGAEEVAIDRSIREQNNAQIVTIEGFDTITSMPMSRQVGLIAAVAAGKFLEDGAVQSTVCLYSGTMAVNYALHPYFDRELFR